MPLKYKIIGKGKAGVKGSANLVSIPSVVINRTLSSEDLEERIANKSRLSRPDVIKVLTIIERIITDEVMQGNIIRFSQLGSFLPVLRGNLSGNEDDTGRIELNLGFRAALKIKKELKEVVFKKTGDET
jgi:nucleoid DNA-binding protein